MSGELSIKLNTTGLTLKACIWGHDRTKRWNGSTMVAPSTITDAAWPTGMVSMAEEQTSDATATGTYTGDFPAGITAPGEYAVEFYSGESPTPGQVSLGEQGIQWAGTAVSQVLPADVLTGSSQGSGVGLGDIPVNHDYDGVDSLAYETSDGAGIDDALVRAYLASDWEAGDRGNAFVKGQTRTTTAGRWEQFLMLDPEDYVLLFYKTGAYGPDLVLLTVS